MKKKRKNGFTLIELLAVIVILAVIALIATPIIVGIINDAEKNAFEDSVYGIVRAGEMRYGSEVLKNNEYRGETLFLDKDELSYSGDRVNGIVLIEDNGAVTASIYDKKKRWCAIKSYESEKAQIGKYEEGKCNVTSIYPVMRSWDRNSQDDFHNTTYRSKIKTLEIVSTNIVPEGVLASWDVSEAKDGSVMAWVTDAGEGYYHLYIGGKKRVGLNADASNFLYEFRNLESANLKLLHTENTINMYNMFFYCESLMNLDLSNFNTSKVTNMSFMFFLCQNLTNVDLSNFDTSNVTNMDSMFFNCFLLADLDLSNFNTSKVTNMHEMFLNCRSITELDLSNFDTRNVTNMGSMFSSCYNLTNLNVSNFNTSNVEYMGSMFVDCISLTSLDLSSFDTRNVEHMGAMFYYCISLTSLDLSHFDTSNVKSMDGMFYKNLALQELKLGKLEHEKVTQISEIFAGVPNTTKVIVKDTDTQNYILGLPSTDRPAAWTTSNVVLG